MDIDSTVFVLTHSLSSSEVIAMAPKEISVDVNGSGYPRDAGTGQ